MNNDNRKQRIDDEKIKDFIFMNRSREYLIDSMIQDFSPESDIWSSASTFTGAVIVVGVVIVIVGLILTITLRRFRKKEINL